MIKPDQRKTTAKPVNPNVNTCRHQRITGKIMPNKCPRCGTLLSLKGGRKGEAKAIAKLLLTLYAERTYVCPKCGYQHKDHTFRI